eukprot:CAMPEP_0197678840 /NCGR_PEP_ID=MMETSP1338-20131121/90691_1 /TAXON_ID=43686 ORGANISM="Pelagodinium beii, Strain RCC1491" /NCGR_SAMPLE_ID=MMETSP1338 /ASSEMBLY_ACC=CAM_ASM_000754 /LENGTH=62 /DNA_ID=CAMNT_0043259823 /DNA_START=1 /DNA_END=189 /DNA_ORIENTATION=+
MLHSALGQVGGLQTSGAPARSAQSLKTSLAKVGYLSEETLLRDAAPSGEEVPLPNLCFTMCL